MRTSSAFATVVALLAVVVRGGPARADFEMTPFVLPDRIISLGIFGLGRSGDSRPVGGGGEINYWQALPFNAAAYAGADLGATDRAAYAEVELGNEFGSWPHRQILAGVGLGGGVTWRDQPNRWFAQATIWANLRFKPSNIPSFVFPFFRFEWSEPLSFQGGLMIHLPITR